MRIDTITSGCVFGLGVLAMLASMTIAAYARTAVAPEIDGSILPAALGFLGAGILMLRARRAK